MRYVDAYCDIAGMSDPSVNEERPCFYAHDGSTCTLIRVRGARTHLSDAEGVDRTVDAFDEISANLREKGHGLTITFEQSENIAEDIDRLLTPLHDAAQRKGISMEASLAETRRLLEQQLVAERIIIAVWTYREAAVPARFRDDLLDRRDAFGRLGISKIAQDPNGPYESLQAAHWGFVATVETALDKAGFTVERLGKGKAGREDLAEIRRALLFHETPQNWRPVGPGDTRYPRQKAKKSSDISSLFAPTLDRQILTSAVKSSNDLRTIEMGGRKYAVAYLSAFPRYMDFFHTLLENIRGTGTRQRTMPFRIAFQIEGGARVNSFKQILATIGSVVSNTNKNIMKALDGIADAMQTDEETFVNVRIVATTWIEPSEDDAVLNDRRSRLVRALNSWQSPVVIDSAADPLRLLVETAPGMTSVCRTGLPFIAPVREMALALPFHSDAPAEQEGETIFVSMDGKPFPFKAHSPLQNSWLTIIYAPPGSGKSVLLNAMNLDFAAFYPSADLPFIGAIDIGVSSLGFVNQLRASLPPEQRKLVQYVRMLNELEAREYRVNPWDIGLGRRFPLKREASFVQNFLLAMIGMPDDPMLFALVEDTVTALYNRFSDMTVSSAQKVWQPSKDKEVDEAAERLGITLHDDLTWWNLTDAFAKRGEFAMAERAQRYAMPVMNDVVRYLSGEEISKKFDPELVKLARTQIISAINQFPCFASETQLDIGEARVVSIDLDAVIYRAPNSDNERRSNVLFFLMARELFVKKVSGFSEELSVMRLPDDPQAREVYQTFWRKRYANIEQTRKRFCFDEFHITGSSPIMARQIDQDIRQGRKWGFELILASQRIQDFEQYVDLASNVFVLKSDTEKDRREMQKVFGVSEAVVESVRKHVNGPSKDISIPPVFLLGRKMTTGESWLFAKNRLGPIRVWALTTTMEDRAVRDMLYRMMGDVDEALKLLASRFPSGSCFEYWKQIASRSDPGADIASIICERMLAERLALRQAAE